MSTPLSVKEQIQKLIDDANVATGNADADLTSAVGALIAGYGSGGSGNYYEFETVLNIAVITEVYETLA